MCIAIVKPKGTVITDEQLRNCFENNSDGAGIAYAENKKLYYVKGIFDIDEFIKWVRKTEKEADGAILIHCRIGTSGLKNKDNCHPFVVNNKTVMIHNGILDIDVPKGSAISDTQIFVNSYLKSLPENFIHIQGIKELIEAAIGRTNKFCFLDNESNYLICNEAMGDWKDGIWFSNNSYDYKPVIKYYGNMYDTRDFYWDNLCEIANRDEEKIRKAIERLDYTDFLKLDKFPYWDAKNKQIVEYSDKNANIYDLFDLDEKLYDDYLTRAELYIPDFNSQKTVNSNWYWR